MTLINEYLTILKQENIQLINRNVYSVFYHGHFEKYLHRMLNCEIIKNNTTFDKFIARRRQNDFLYINTCHLESSPDYKKLYDLLHKKDNWVFICKNSSEIYNLYSQANVEIYELEYVIKGKKYSQLVMIRKKTQTTGLKRNTTDKYYTKSHIAKHCINLVEQHIDINHDDICIEPSAGAGSFIPYIKKIFDNYVFYDLFPEHEEIITMDYLKFDPTVLSSSKKHIIGNPPFGRQSSMAIKFVKKSAEYCDSISFILPKSFKKDSLKKHFPLNFHLVYEYDIPDNSFTVDNTDYNVPCVFQIWVKKSNQRKVKKKLVPEKYHFVKKHEPHDIAFRRVGVYAGKISKDTHDKSIQSHYFIRFDNFTKKLFDKLSKVNFTSNNTVGPKSISKQELIYEFNKLLLS